MVWMFYVFLYVLGERTHRVSHWSVDLADVTFPWGVNKYRRVAINFSDEFLAYVSKKSRTVGCENPVRIFL